MTQSTLESISFDEAIKQAKETSKKLVLLLGNGFSIAAHDSFNYKNLYDEVSEDMETDMPEVYSIFESGNHKDFEEVSNFLRIASYVLPNYEETELADRIDDHRKKLGEVLIETIESIHPKQQNIFDGNTEKSCQEFLSHFKKGAVYTLNYDLLLYWVIIKALSNSFRDGFGLRRGKTWDPESDQNLFFLHGNFYLYKEPSSNHIEKLIHGGSSGFEDILTQVTESIKNEGRFPLFVSEGSGEDKLTKIRDNAYLRYCYEDLKYTLKQSDVSLFIFGCSLDEHDEHILKIIREGECKVFCSTYDASPEDVNNGNYTHCNLCNKEEAYPVGLSPSNIRGNQRGPTFFCAESAKAWGEDGNLGQGSGEPPPWLETWLRE